MSEHEYQAGDALQRVGPPGADPIPPWLRVVIYMDGRRLRDVVEAEAGPAGRVVRFKRNAAGRLYVDPDDPGEAAREELTGEVSIYLVEAGVEGGDPIR